MGLNAEATADFGFAVGNGAEALGTASFAVGNNTSAVGQYAVALEVQVRQPTIMPLQVEMDLLLLPMPLQPLVIIALPQVWQLWP